MVKKKNEGIIMNEKKIIYAVFLFGVLLLINGFIIHSPETAREWGEAAALPIMGALIYYFYPSGTQAKPEGNYFINKDGQKVFEKKV
jgi:hypothetical protein